MYVCTHTHTHTQITLPNGSQSTVAYEPTRGIGHAMGQYFGITPAPSVCLTLRPNMCICVCI